MFYISHARFWRARISQQKISLWVLSDVTFIVSRFESQEPPKRKCNYSGLALKDYTQHPTFRFFVFVVLSGKVDNSCFDSKKSIVPRLLTRGHWGRNVFKCVVNATRELPLDHSLLQLFYFAKNRMIAVLIRVNRAKRFMAYDFYLFQQHDLFIYMGDSQNVS